jgi:hypothetical protein
MEKFTNVKLWNNKSKVKILDEQTFDEQMFEW